MATINLGSTLNNNAVNYSYKPFPNLDSKYGPYETTTVALLLLPKTVRSLGLTVGISNNDSIVEYWFKNGIEDADLIPKNGNIDFSTHKTYNSVSDMNADKANPIGDNGEIIKIGELVTVYNSTTPSENGIYSYLGSINGFKYQSSFSLQTVQSLGNSESVAISQKGVTDAINFVRDNSFQTFFINNSLVNLSGSIVTDPTKPNFCRTDYINISGSEKITIIDGFQNPYCCSVAFYDKDKTFISGIIFPDSVEGKYNSVINKSSFPANAVYAIGTSNSTYYNRAFITSLPSTKVYDEFYSFETIVENGFNNSNSLINSLQNDVQINSYFTTYSSKKDSFFKEAYLTGTGINPNKIYYLRLVVNNDATFQNGFFIAESDADFSNSCTVLSLLNVTNANRDKILTVTSSTYNLSFSAIIDWNAFPEGNSGEVLRMVLNKRAFNKYYNPVIAFQLEKLKDDVDYLNINAVTSATNGQIYGGYIDSVQIKPESGEAPSDSNSTYSEGSGYAVWQKLQNSIVFNKMSLPVYKNSSTLTPVTLQIAILDAPMTFGTYLSTFKPYVVVTKKFADIAQNPISKTTDFVLDEPLKVAKDKYLYILIGSDNAATQKLVIATFNGQNSGSTRHNWVYTSATPDVFADTASWLLSSGSTYLQTQFTLIIDTGTDDLTTLKNDVNDLQIKVNNNILCIPDTIYAVVGQELNIYYDSIIKALDAGLNSPSAVYIDFECPDLQNASNQIAVRRDRMWQIQSSQLTADYIGSHDVLVTAFDSLGNQLDQKHITLEVISNSPLTLNKYILCIGDSLTNNGPIVATCAQHFIDIGGVQPTFIGQRTTSGYKHEGYPGYSFGSFVSDSAGYTYHIFDVPSGTSVSINDVYSTNETTYTVKDIRTEGLDNNLRLRCERLSGTTEPTATGVLTKVSGASSSQDSINYSAYEAESGNPFWDNATGANNFTEYRNKMGMGTNKFDAVFILLGTNDCIGNTIKDMSSSVNNAKILINSILTDAASYPTKILLQLTPPDANTISSWQVYSDLNSGIGRKMSYWNNLWSLRQLLYKEFTKPEWVGKVILGGAALGVDRYYGFPYSTIKSSTRIQVDEIYHTNSVHPNNQGYQQIGDGYFLQAKKFL